MINRAIAALLLASCAPTWTNASHVTEGAAIGGLMCDGLQTHQWRSHAAESGLEEQNPILGTSPSTPEVAMYLGVIAFGVVVANRLLPAWAATAVNSTVMAVETHAYVTNTYFGSSAACGLGGWDEQTAEFRVMQAQQQQ